MLEDEALYVVRGKLYTVSEFGVEYGSNIPAAVGTRGRAIGIENPEC